MIADNFGVAIFNELKRLLDHEIFHENKISQIIKEEVRAAFRQQSLSRNNQPYYHEMNQLIDMVKPKFMKEQNRVDIVFEECWTRRVDQLFGSGVCHRCLRFVAMPDEHDQVECDDHLIDGVLRP